MSTRSPLLLLLLSLCAGLAACGAPPDAVVGETDSALTVPTYSVKVQQVSATPTTFELLTDLNHDGTLDLVLLFVKGKAAPYDCMIELRIGDGKGAFINSWQTSCQRMSGRAGQLLTGDFNGDHLVDLAFLESLENAPSPVHILLGDGRGRLLPDKVYGMPLQTGGIAVADLDGDGRSDVVGAFFDPGSDAAMMALMRGRANGSLDGPWIRMAAFMPSATAPPAYHPPHSDCGVALGDFNGDHRPDVAIACQEYFRDLIYWAGGNGDGSFGAFSSWMTAGDSGRRPLLATGDINHDGLDDLVDTTVTYLFTALSAGHTPLATRQTSIDAGGGALADLNNDGQLDLLSFDPASPTLLFDDGSGAFKAFAKLPLPPAAGAFAAGDVDGNGGTDIVVASSDLSGRLTVFLQQ